MSAQDVFHILLGIPLTVALTVGSFLIGAVLGFPLLLLRVTRFRPLRFLLIAVFAFVRALPPILWLFLIFFGLGAGVIRVSPFAASLAAFGLISAVNLAEIYRGGLLSIHHGQWEATRALNIPLWSTWRDVIAPQIFRVSLPGATTYAIGLMKDSAIASTVGVTELAYRGRLIQQMTHEGLAAFATVGLGYILLSLPVAAFARSVERRLKKGVAA